MARLLPWLGLFLLASGRLHASEFFGASSLLTWLTFLLAGTALLTSLRPTSNPDSRSYLIGAALVLPSLLVLGEPERIGACVLVAGLLLTALRPGRAATRLAHGMAIAGASWLLMGLTIFVYGSITARTPMLPDFLIDSIAMLGRLAGIHLAVDGGEIVMFSMRTKHALAATWAWFADPATCSFVVTGTAVLLLSTNGKRLRRLAAFAATVGCWLFARATLSIAIYMHFALTTDYDSPLDHVSMLWDPWVHSALLLPLALLTAWSAPIQRSTPLLSAEAPVPADLPASHAQRPLRTSILAGLATLLLIAGFLWHPSGDRKGGRILINESHSKITEWSKWRWHSKRFDTTSTLRPYDTEWYGEDAAYNYASLFEYLTRFYDVDRLDAPIDDKALQDCDVFVVKVPTKYFEDSEVAAIHRFVARGGGLMLIGEHTSVFGSGVTLNQIAREYGFEFRYDCVFGIDSVFKQSYEPWLVPHPASQYMGRMEIAISCSIDPGSSSGTAVLRGIGLKNLDADYHAPNAYPQPIDAAEMIPGSFVQAWATDSGDGRVLAFTDSTIMANFSFFEPGKSELFLGMVEWLNRGQGMPTAWLAILGLLGSVVVIGLVVRSPAHLVPVIGTTMLAFAVGTVAVRTLHKSSLPFPERSRPVVEVGFDRSLCTAITLPDSGFIGGKDDGYGLFERSCQRLTKPSTASEPGLPWITRRVERIDGSFQGDLLVFVLPNEVPSADTIEILEQYVRGGGKLLILDAQRETSESTADALLAPFGMSIDRGKVIEGKVLAEGFPAIPVEKAYAIRGGTPLMSAGGAVVAAGAKLGAGSVWALGFGRRFADTAMGITGDVIPNDEVRRVYAFEFALMRAIHKGDRLRD